MVQRQFATHWLTWRPKALVGTLDKTLTETDAETLGNTLCVSRLLHWLTPLLIL